MTEWQVVVRTGKARHVKRVGVYPTWHAAVEAAHALPYTDETTLVAYLPANEDIIHLRYYGVNSKASLPIREGN